VGPVVAAAVILDPDHPIEGLADSKKLSSQKREKLSVLIKEHALCYAIEESSVQEIDELNILQATLLAMQRAVLSLQIEPRQVLIDGNRLPVLPMACHALVGGDDRVQAISAASILAKVHRDRWCDQLESEYPGYGFAKHKGYGTQAHANAMKALGLTPWHRRSFAPVSKQLAHCPQVLEYPMSAPLRERGSKSMA
jgi:ribonuclease HII